MTRQLRIEPDGVAIDAAGHDTILQAARRGGIALPYECGWGSCGACKVTLIDGQVDLIFPGAPAVNPRDARRNRILACQSRAISDVTIARGPGDWSAPTPRCVEQQAILRGIDDLAPEIRQFSFETAEPIDFRPGQYAILHLGNGLRRCYSMCNLPGSTILQFIAKRYDGGTGSNALAALAPGTRITIEAPFGVCTLRRQPGRKVFVAGGTGIAPILAMLREAAAAHLDFGSPVEVIYGARTPADLAADDMLAAAITQTPPGALPARGRAHAVRLAACGRLRHRCHPGRSPGSRGGRVLRRRPAGHGERGQIAAARRRCSDHAGSL